MGEVRSTVMDLLRGQAPQPSGVLAGATTSSLQAHLGEQRAASRPVSYVAGQGGKARGVLQLDPRAKDYSASAVAYRCVQVIADNASSVPLVVLRDQGAQGEVIVPHPIADLWNRGTPGAPFSARVLQQVTWQRLELTGEAFVYVDRGPTGEGEPQGLWPIHDQVEVLAAGADDALGAGTIVGYVVKRGSLRIPLLPSEVLWLRYPDPFEPWAALAPWKAALYATEADAYARAWQVGELRNGARPSHVVHLGDVDEDVHTTAVQEYRANVEGPGNAGRSLIVSGPGTPLVQRIGLTPAEMSYLESRARNADEVMLAFGITRDYLLGGSTYENRTASRGQLWGDKIVPSLDVVASELDRQAVPEDNLQAGWDLSDVDALQESADALTSRARDGAHADLLMVDEARATLGYPPLPGGIGQHTLTAYREVVLRSLEAGDELPTPAEAARLVLPPPRQLIRVGRVTRALRTAAPATARARKPRGVPQRQVLRFYDRNERVGARALERLAAKQQRVVLRNLDKLKRSQLEAWAEHRAHATPALEVRAGVGALELSELQATPPCGCTRIAADDLFDPDWARLMTAEATEAFMAGVWEGGGQLTAGSLGVSFDVFDQRVLAAMDSRRDVLANQVTATTRAILDAQLLQAGVEGGESIPQLADRIRGVFSDLAGFRAVTIARTETVGGYNAASHLAAAASGVVVGRTWLSTADDRTREDHVFMDGEQVQGLEARYSVGLLHPGEPGGPPEQVINCRCVETFEVED